MANKNFRPFNATFTTYRYPLVSVPCTAESPQVERLLLEKLKKSLKKVRVLDLDFVRSARYSRGTLAIDLGFPYGDPITPEEVWSKVKVALEDMSFTRHDVNRYSNFIASGGRHPLAR